jgi:hypothetical protein
VCTCTRTHPQIHTEYVCACVYAWERSELSQHWFIYVIVPHFHFSNDVKYFWPVVDGGGYSAVRLKTLRGSVTVWTAGARRF